MIATMGAKVEWKGNFVVLNHFLILSGRVRSLVLNFENRKVGTNVIELPDREEDMEQVEGNEILANVLNMSLYAFGKWGMIKGLKVDQDDQQLNGLFSAVLKDLKIRPDYRSDHFRFYQEGVQVTYEEVVQAAIEEGKRKAQEPQKEPEKAERERKAGLWHNMCWRIERCAFSKEETDAYERTASRLGNNFYITGYLCPSCKAKLYMCVYPQGKEFPVETEEGKVYLARSYTCDSCSLYYTPRPGKLLREGDAYALKFGKDRDAYEDYRELLGQQGARVSNYNFNEYAADRGKGPAQIWNRCQKRSCRIWMKSWKQVFSLWPRQSLTERNWQPSCAGGRSRRGLLAVQREAEGKGKLLAVQAGWRAMLAAG